jgi:hypothetical protein
VNGPVTVQGMGPFGGRLVEGPQLGCRGNDLARGLRGRADVYVNSLGLFCEEIADAFNPAIVAAQVPVQVQSKSKSKILQESLRVQPDVLAPQGKDFLNPTINGIGVDFCLNWATNCGKPAADAFCRAQGYAEAGGYTYLENRPPTFVIGDLRVCDAPGCTRFTQIACQKTASAAATVPPAGQGQGQGQGQAKPASLRIQPVTGQGGLPLYECQTTNDQLCRQPVADAFCQQQGFARATGFDVDSRKAKAETITGERCTRKKCRVFDWVVCAR